MSLGRCVTQEQAKTILEQLECLVSEDEVNQFTEWLNATAETIRPLIRIAELYAKADGSIAMLRRSLPQIVSNLVEMEVAATEPEIMQFPELLKLDDVRRILAPANDLKLTLAHPPAAFAGIADKRRRGTKPRFWYPGFLRDLVEIANFLAIPVTTSADRSANPHDTRFTWLVFVAEELLLPSGMASDSLATCARRIDRAIHAALNLLDEDRNLEAVLSANDLSDIAHLS